MLARKNNYRYFSAWQFWFVNSISQSSDMVYIVGTLHRINSHYHMLLQAFYFFCYFICINFIDGERKHEVK